MELSLKDRAQLIVDFCLNSTSKDPAAIFTSAAGESYVRMHGPEHHVLDGAALLTAFHNAGGKLDLEAALCELMNRGLQMPGAACGHWGVCGAVSSMGAALSIIDGTGPLSGTDWGEHMRFTSAALLRMAEVGGPRCCKRDAFLTFAEAVKYINSHYSVSLPESTPICSFYKNNGQCLKSACPYFPKG